MVGESGRGNKSSLKLNPVNLVNAYLKIEPLTELIPKLSFNVRNYELNVPRDFYFQPSDLLIQGIKLDLCFTLRGDKEGNVPLYIYTEREREL